MSFSPQRMASKLQSRSVRQPVASGVFEFIKEGKANTGVMAMAISAAVFGEDKKAKGYLAAVVDLSTLLQSATSLADAAKFDLLVFSADNPAEAPIFSWYGDDSDLKKLGADVHLAVSSDQSAPVKFAHQTWRVVLHPRPAFFAQFQEYGSRLVLAAGMVLTLLITLAVYRLQSSHRKIVRAESVASSARLAQKLLSEQLLEAQRIAHVGSWRLDVASNQFTWSEEMFRMHGLRTQGQPPKFTDQSSFFVPESWHRLNTSLLKIAESGGSYELELEMVKPDGSHGWMLARGEAVRDANGTIVAVQGTAADISEHKRLEAQIKTELDRSRELNTKLEQVNNQLLQSEKMAAIGQLAAGVAHEINNPLGFIVSNLGSLERYVDDLLDVIEHAQKDAETTNDAAREKFRQLSEEKDIHYIQTDIRQLLAESKEGADRVRRIVQSLKEFSHVDENEWQFADLHKGIDSTLTLVWNELKHKVEVRKEYGHLPEVYCLAPQINQVILNLLINASQAIENRGTVTIRTGEQDASAESEPHVWIEVEDTGRGIPPEMSVRV